MARATTVAGPGSLSLGVLAAHVKAQWLRGEGHRYTTDVTKPMTPQYAQAKAKGCWAGSMPVTY